MKFSADEQAAIIQMKARVDEAYGNFNRWAESGGNDDWHEPSWIIESCFLQLLALAEGLGLVELRTMVHAEFQAIKAGPGFADSGTNPEGEPYSEVLGRINCFVHALQNLFHQETPTAVTKDLLRIVRDTQYVITNKDLFRTAPTSESDVHVRIEGILKCVFPDLKHKPVLTKQIKNFEPDTGIPSLKTLIEYKFLSRTGDAPIIADQILADTRGYHSSEWTRFLYVIYETHRFRSEKDWNQLLTESGVSLATTAVVLTGEPRGRGRPHGAKNGKGAAQPQSSGYSPPPARPSKPTP